MVNCATVKSPLGLLKCILIALLVAIVCLSYYGNQGGRLFFGLQDFLGVGVAVGFAIIFPLVLLTYLAEGNILVFELLLSLLGTILFLIVGVVTLDSYSHPEYGAPAGKALAGLCFAVSDQS